RLTDRVTGNIERERLFSELELRGGFFGLRLLGDPGRLFRVRSTSPAGRGRLGRRSSLPLRIRQHAQQEDDGEDDKSLHKRLLLHFDVSLLLGRRISTGGSRMSSLLWAQLLHVTIE